MKKSFTSSLISPTNSGKRLRYLLASLFVLASIAVIVSAVLSELKWHAGTEVNEDIDGSQITLQEAIDQNLLINNGLTPKILNDPLAKADPGHSMDEIWISIKESGVRTEMILKDAFSSARNLCGDSDFAGYTDLNIPNPVQLATEIEITNKSRQTKTLQKAIDDKELLYTINAYSSCYTGDRYWNSSCNVRGNKREKCGPSDYYGNYYCSSGDVYRGYNTTGCSLDSCTDSLAQNKIKECSSGTCNGNDCYLGWTSKSDPYISRCNSQAIASGLPSDTCPGSDEDNAYSCSSSTNAACLDVDYLSCTTQSCGEGTNCYTLNWRERTVNCYSP